MVRSAGRAGIGYSPDLLRGGHQADEGFIVGDSRSLLRIPLAYPGGESFQGRTVLGRTGPLRRVLRHQSALVQFRPRTRLDTYLEALRTGLGADGDTIFGHCTQYPGSANAQAWSDWLLARGVPSALFFAAYGDQTVAEIHADQRTGTFWRVETDAAGPLPLLPGRL